MACDRQGIDPERRHDLPCRDPQMGYLDDMAVTAEGVLYNNQQLHVLQPDHHVLLVAKYLISILGVF